MTKTPWSNVYGLARTLLALGTLMTLTFNSTRDLFLTLGPDDGSVRSPLVEKTSLFLLVPEWALPGARLLAIAILVLVISGWRPRVTGLLHWWVSYSYFASSLIIDGGDQVTSVLSALLIPVTLTDSRRWHWSSVDIEMTRTPAKVGAMVGASALTVIRLQVAWIYLEAFVEKLSVAEWTNGTAVYYWFTHPGFGVSESLVPLVSALLSHPWVVVPVSWSVLALEVMLFSALLMERRWWSTMLKLGLVFHLSIVLLHGLITFFFAMAAALVLYLRPAEDRFSAPRWVRGLAFPRGRVAATEGGQILAAAERG